MRLQQVRNHQRTSEVLERDQKRRQKKRWSVFFAGLGRQFGRCLGEESSTHLRGVGEGSKTETKKTLQRFFC